MNNSENAYEASKLMLSRLGKEFSWMWFLEPANQPDIMMENKKQRFLKYKDGYDIVKLGHLRDKKIIKVKKSSGNTPTISKYFNSWKKYHFFNPVIRPIERIDYHRKYSKFSYPLKIYNLNLNAFFSFFNEINFSEKEKRILDFLFFPWWIRYSLKNKYGNTDLFNAISRFYAEFYLPSAIENKRNIKSEFNFKKEFLDLFINNEPYTQENSMNKPGKIKFTVSEKTSKIQKIQDNNWEAYNMYLNGPILFKDNLKDLEIDHYFFTSLYFSLYQYYKKDMDNLNVHMLKILNKIKS